MNGAVTLCLPPGPSSREETDTDQEESGRGGHYHLPQLAGEILVSPTPPDGIQDPTPAPMQDGSPVTIPVQQGHTLPH